MFSRSIVYNVMYYVFMRLSYVWAVFYFTSVTSMPKTGCPFVGSSTIDSTLALRDVTHPVAS